MKIIVFGATGGVGQHVVKQALEKGMDVTHENSKSFKHMGSTTPSFDRSA